MKEIYKVFEDTITRNVKMILNHSNQTRKKVVDLENKIKQLNEQIIIQDIKIEDLRKMIVSVQVKIFSGGT